MADPADTGAPTHSTDLADARLGVRLAGYCLRCDRIVERTATGGCPSGHTADKVTGRLPLFDDEVVPRLPRFNTAAFLVPFIWGPAHGEWAGLLFLPVWLFMDAIVAVASRIGIAPTLAALAAVAFTLVLQALFAKRANGTAFCRVMGKMTAEEFVSRENRWALASTPATIALLAWAVWIGMTVAPVVVR